ncbi:MAG: agmatinase family protein [Candidatus Njordarchaeia archaeon]
MTSQHFIIDERDVKIYHLIQRGEKEESPNIGIIGLPFDGATRGRPGARFGPRKVREFLYKYSAFCIDFGIDLSKLTFRDYGDLDLGFGSVEDVKKQIIDSIANFYKNVELGIVLGGDHSITEPSIGGLLRAKKGKLGIVVIDAHHDLRELPPKHVSSGTVMGEIIEKYGDRVSPENIIQIGIRGFVNSKYYIEKAEKLGIKVFTSRDVRKIGIEKIASDIQENLLEDVDIIYFSFDVDGVDISYAPGVNSPSSGGLTPWDVFELAYGVGKNKKAVAMDINEFAPAYDVADMTADLVANAILYFIGGFAGRE